MAQIDDAANHVMRSHVRGDGYVTLAWPKNATLKDLEWIRAACILQLDTFISSARRETEREEAARLEYESWNCSAADGVSAPDHQTFGEGTPLHSGTPSTPLEGEKRQEGRSE